MVAAALCILIIDKPFMFQQLEYEMDSSFHDGVYIQGCQKIDPYSNIVMSGFPPSVCQVI